MRQLGFLVKLGADVAVPIREMGGLRGAGITGASMLARRRFESRYVASFFSFFALFIVSRSHKFVFLFKILWLWAAVCAIASSTVAVLCGTPNVNIVNTNAHGRRVRKKII